MSKDVYAIRSSPDLSCINKAFRLSIIVHDPSFGLSCTMARHNDFVKPIVVNA